MKNTSRRRFLRTTAAMATVTILPSGLLKAAPNSKPDIAAVGVGGKGWSDITETSTNDAANVVAACGTCNFQKGGCSLEELSLQDPFDSSPVPSEWDGLDGRLGARPL